MGPDAKRRKAHVGHFRKQMQELGRACEKECFKNKMFEKLAPNIRETVILNLKKKNNRYIFS